MRFEATVLAVLLHQAAAAKSSGIVSVPITITATPTATTAPVYSQPCAEVSKSFTSLVEASGTPLIPASLGYQCLKSVPVDTKGDSILLNEISEILDWQTTLAYLKNPPSGYNNPSIDLKAGIQNISSTLSSGGYKSDYDVQLDISSFLNKAYDGHLGYLSDMAGVIIFGRVGGLVSASVDGTSLPGVFLYQDLAEVNQGAKFNASAIKTINGRPANDYLNDLATADGGFHDPDARYNNLFFNIAKRSYGAVDQGGTFTGLTGQATYDGDVTELVHENGTKTNIDNIALLAADFTGVTTGASFFKKFCTGADNTLDLSSYTSAAASMPAAPTATGYPWPVVKTEDNVVAGYYLNDTGYQNVAVLSIPSFLPTDPDDFQAAVRSFLGHAVKAAKKYLIIDLRANGGGATELGYDLFKQLFPSTQPYGGTRWRGNPAFNAMGQVTSAWADSSNVTGNATLLEMGLVDDGALIAEFWSNTSLNTDDKDFANWADLFGPHQFNGDNFTSVVRTNFSDPLSVGDDEFEVSGYNNDAGATQPFAPENIVLLQDGYCSSTCAIFTELVKTQGKVKQVAIGGRPLYEPMQAVGGTKGAETISWATLTYKAAAVEMLATTDAEYELLTSSGVDTLANLSQIFIRTAASAESGDIAGQINYRDNLREGDTSQTPLQFVYEPAECRIFYTPQMIFDPTKSWEKVYDVMWGKGQCVQGSATNGTADSANSTSSGRKKSAAPAVGASGHALVGAMAAFFAVLLAL